MRDKVKRFLSILMTALMLVNLLPVGALAEGVKISNSVQSRAQKPDGYPVFVFVEVQGNTDGLTMNSDKLFTLGMVKSMNDVTKPPKPVTGYQNNINGVTADDVTAAMTRYKPNESINLGGIRWKGFKSENGASDTYPAYKNQACWHLDGWIKIEDLKVNYTIRYVDENNNKEIASSETKTGKAGSYTKLENNDIKDITGYTYTGKYDPMQKLVGGKDTVINVYYRPNSYSYRVEHYYDGKIDNSKTDTSSALYGSNVNVGTDAYKLKDGYEHEKTENSPLTIGTDESKNVIKVYYKKIGYTVTYEPDEHGDFEAKAYNAKHGDATPAFDGETTGKPGWKFDGWEPEVAKTVTGNATYTAQWKAKEVTVTYNAEYGDKTDTVSTQAISVFSAENLEAVTAPNKTKEGCAFDGWFKGDKRLTSKEITELSAKKAEGNLNKDKNDLFAATTFTAKYVPLTATVNYIVEKDGVQVETPISTQTISVIDGEPLEDVTANPIEGYRFEGWYLHDVRIDEAEGSTLEAATAKVKLHKIEPLYTDTTFVAKFVPDKTKIATVLYTISIGQSDYGSIAPSAQQIILQATGKLDSDVGGSVSGSTATAKPGYKFAGWYKATGEATYEWVTGDPELTSELAESKLNRDEKTGLYQNTVFEARFEPDAGAKVPVTYKAENGTLEGTTSQEAQIVTGDGLTDVTAATPNKGYKFDGWYVVDKNDNETRISGLDPAEKLDAEAAKKNLNKDGNLYAATTFIARFVPDTKQSAKVIYTTDGNGTLWGGPAIKQITQFVQIVTGEVVREDGSVIGDKLTTIPTYPKDGYEFDRWIRVFPEKTIEGAGSALTDEKARPNLNQENGLYQKTEFRAIFKPRTNLSYTVNYYWNGTTEKVTESKTIGGKMFGEEMTESPIGVEGYTPVSTESQTITLGTGKNEINFYYYKNVKLIANSDEKTYDGKPKSVSDYTCAVAEMKNGRLEYVPWTGEPLTFEFVGAFGSGTDAGDHEVTFKEGSVGENNGLYYVKEVQPGTLTIKPALIKLRAPIASKPYDGTPLKAEDYGYGYEGNTDLADDFKSISVEGSQTMVGSSASSVTYTLKDRKKPQNYDIQCIPGTLTITPVMDEVLVKIKGNTANVTYDGKLYSVEGYAVDSISNPLYTKDDFKYNGDAKAEGTDATTYPMNLAETQFENTNTNFKNVRFEVVEDGQLVINPRPVVLTSADLTKVYDGTALTNGDTPVTEMFGTENAFPEGEGLDYTFTGSQTLVGSSANTFTYKPNDNTKADNYTFEVKFGTLEVTPVTDKVTVTIKGGKSSVTYNGEEHTVSGYKVADISNPLYKEANFTFSGTAEAKGKNAGTYKMGLKAADFANTSNNFTNVEFVVADGQLEITKRPVMLTSANLIKVYDGTPLKNGDTPVKEEFGTEDAFPEGEGVTYTFKGSQTNAGSSKNMFTYAWNEGTNKDNYTIYQVEGDLVVTPIDGIKVTITGHKDTQTYDGKEHSVFGFDAKPSNKLYNPKEDMQFNGTDVDMTAKGTDAGQYDIGLTAEHFTNKSNNFTNVTFVVTDGYVKINPRPVTLTSETASKTYDGTALEKPVVTVGGDGFVEGQVTEIKATGSVTNAGSVANTITFTPNKETFKEGNYAITKTEGTLTIAKRSVLITSQSATKTYDGSALTRPAVTITGDGFVPGELAKAEATGSITKVGSTPNAIQYTTTGAFNAANYSIALSVGTLTVTEKPKPEPRRTFNLTINYVYQNGKRAAASYNRGGLKNGETFDITSPVIAGYTASETVVSGTIYNRDIKVTVIYTADGVNLDDYGVPLGLGNITMNVGDCFE